MTSILNLPAIYHYAHSTNTDMYTAYCEGVIIGQSFSKDECEWLARKHFTQIILDIVLTIYYHVLIGGSQETLPTGEQNV